MDAQREKEKALALANILALTCRSAEGCLAMGAGMQCPFDCSCDEVTTAHWYAHAHKKEN